MRSILVTGKNFNLVSALTGVSISELRKRYESCKAQDRPCVITYYSGDGDDG
jgi:hypothetical protein